MSTGKKNGASGPHHRAKGAGEPRPPALDVAKLLQGRTLLVTGATGFVGKVALSMLLHRYPGLGRVYVLVRPGTGGTAEARFFGKVAHHRPFDPLRAQHGDRYEAFLREKVVPVAGDVSSPLFGLAPEDLEKLAGLDLVVNSAGLVDFDPSIELAFGVNVHGARNAVELCLRLGAGLVHVSTCFVAGNRDGVVFEDEPVVGYFPRRAGAVERTKGAELEPVDFGVESELADAERRIAEARAQAEDRVLQSRFRERARERLREAGRPPDDEKALRLAIGREKRLWLSERLVELGMERARHWGWPNTYTYTKSLGEQAIAASGVPHAIVRPSIVESALRYPFAGWNEGFTTSAPLAFMGLRGHRTFPMGEKAILDVVPVDLVAAGIILAGAELLHAVGAGKGAAAKPDAPSAPISRVYHLASSDVNPLWATRAVELTALYRRRFFKNREEGNATWNKVLARIEPLSTSKKHWETFSTPALLSLAQRARRFIDEQAPRWGTPRLSALLHGVGNEIDEWTRKLEQTQAMWELYLPFVWDNRYVFRCANVRALRDRLAPEDRARLPWDPEALDWRRYWMEVHMKGMEEWVFRSFDEEREKKVHGVKAHHDLLELLDASAEQHKHRVAFRMGGAVKERMTYGELRRLSDRVAAFLAAAGVKRGDRVLLASENRPEWAVAYFGILRAGAAAVPVDAQLTEAELVNLWRSAGARIAIVSDEVAERVTGLREKAAGAVPGASLVLLGEALQGGPSVPSARPSPEDLASLIFTSGTTGTPKGVMLSHRNFASLVAKLEGIFDLGPGDGLLSVLPLHHTFEFACGLLVPLARGAEIEYLDELTSDRIGEALGSGRVTAMIGVPALWSLLHRRITQELAAQPGLIEQAFELLRKGNGALRDSKLGWNLGKLLFWPVHRKLGGRLRFLVSGGSALDPEIQDAFRELGLDLYQGYGLTEAAPVLAVGKPGEAPLGSVGAALPGVELRIEDPDAHGVGEVLAKGPNVMMGYWRGGEQPGVDMELTGEVLAGGWLRTGDLGRLDEEGNLVLVGRKKDVIIEATGKNVYPDEVEERYRKPGLIKELCAVGLPDGTAEKVALLVVPEYGDRARAEVRAEIEAHLRAVSTELPFHARARVWHLVDFDLPKTATRKVKRPLVREELVKLEAAAAKGAGARRAREERGGEAWLLDLLAEVSRRPRSAVTGSARLQADLGFDSLMLTELTAALEEAGVPDHAADQLHAVQTVDELVRLVSGAVRRGEVRAAAPSRKEGAAEKELQVPATVARLGRKLLSAGQRFLYEEFYETTVHGAGHVPHDRNVLVVSNHASHLDMGLVKVALGDEGERLAALAARDYFFDTPVKRAYFENFTNLIPMDREGSLKTSLRTAIETLRRGYHLLIFPEGTRSRDGALKPFFPTAGYLALTAGVDVLPVFLSGTHDALPPGGGLPKRGALEVRIGLPIPVAALRKAGEKGTTRGESYRLATALMEDAVKRLRDEAMGVEEPAASRSAHPERSGEAAESKGERQADEEPPRPAPAHEQAPHERALLGAPREEP
ncbi:MAG TPA: AMP-binding protein [Anaeromyxobacter sp.]|nr:AMP-binding protein [Anaeromyxobacter sp.]